jgi:hypothetical protein
MSAIACQWKLKRNIASYIHTPVNQLSESILSAFSTKVSLKQPAQPLRRVSTRLTSNSAQSKLLRTRKRRKSLKNDMQKDEKTCYRDEAPWQSRTQERKHWQKINRWAPNSNRAGSRVSKMHSLLIAYPLHFQTLALSQSLFTESLQFQNSELQSSTKTTSITTYKNHRCKWPQFTKASTSSKQRCWSLISTWKEPLEKTSQALIPRTSEFNYAKFLKPYQYIISTATCVDVNGLNSQ